MVLSQRSDCGWNAVVLELWLTSNLWCQMLVWVNLWTVLYLTLIRADCPHTSFQNVRAPENCPSRESIEARMIVITRIDDSARVWLCRRGEHLYVNRLWSKIWSGNVLSTPQAFPAIDVRWVIIGFLSHTGEQIFTRDISTRCVDSEVFQSTMITPEKKLHPSKLRFSPKRVGPRHTRLLFRHLTRSLSVPPTPASNHLT